MRIPNRYLPHKVTIEPYDPMGGGRRFLPARPGIMALTAPKAQLVVDQRPDSESVGQMVQTSTMVIVQPEQWTTPGGRVTIWPGTEREAKLSLVAVDTYDHDIAPNSVVLWLV